MRSQTPSVQPASAAPGVGGTWCLSWATPSLLRLRGSPVYPLAPPGNLNLPVLGCCTGTPPQEGHHGHSGPPTESIFGGSSLPGPRQCLLLTHTLPEREIEGRGETFCLQCSPHTATTSLPCQALAWGNSWWAGLMRHLVEEHGLQKVDNGSLVVYLSDKENRARSC